MYTHNTEEIWASLKSGLLKIPEDVCGTTKPYQWQKETWWWNNLVKTSVRAKRQAFKAWKAGKGIRLDYDLAKGIARQAVHCSCHESDKVVHDNIDPKSSTSPTRYCGKIWMLLETSQ